MRRQRLDLVLFGHIGEDRYRLDPEVADLAHDRVGLGLVGARVDDDVGAFARQLQRRRTADIAAGAGDQGDLPIEVLPSIAPQRRRDWTIGASVAPAGLRANTGPTGAAAAAGSPRGVLLIVVTEF